MEYAHKKLFIAFVGIASGFFLFISSESQLWFVDELFAIIVSLFFISPVITAFFNVRFPREYIVVFCIGGTLFMIYSILSFTQFYEWIGFLFKTIFVSFIATFATIFVRKIEKIIPPDT